MIKVPGSRGGKGGRAQQRVDPKYVAMAAAVMHENDQTAKPLDTPSYPSQQPTNAAAG